MYHGGVREHSTLLQAFGAALTTAAEPAEALDEALQRAWAEARDAWPTFVVEPERFAEALGARLEDDKPLVEAIGAYPAAELYLVLGCAAGHREAIEALIVHHLTPLRPAVARLGASADQIDDVFAQVRARLLVAEPDDDPRILQFRGRSSLTGWLKVIVVREALTMLRRDKGSSHEDEELEALLVSTQDVELDSLRARYRSEFRDAFGAALASLAPEQRNVLRHHLIDRLSIDEIGDLHGVHRSTAARWLERIRDRLFVQTRTRLMHDLQLDSGEFTSLLGLVRSQLDYSIGRHLGVAADADSG